jgi:hypothetical protein
LKVLSKIIQLRAFQRIERISICVVVKAVVEDIPLLKITR